MLGYGTVLTINLSNTALLWDEIGHLNGGLLISRGQATTWALTNSFYPPIYDLFTALFFLFFNPNVFAARFVSVTFSVFTLFVLYKIAVLLYNSKPIAFLSAVLLGVMPGIIWLSRVALIETLLLFMLSLSLFFFFCWLKNSGKTDLRISIAALVIGGMVKYQAFVIVPIIMLISAYFWKKAYFEAEIKKWLSLPRLALILIALVAVVSAVYALVSTGTVDFLLYAVGVGSQQKTAYSVRYPLPIFYLVEMTWPNSLFHPISLLLYAVSLIGIGFLVYRRTFDDKLLLLWFAVVYLVFTFIPNREWRYVTVAFPVLAIASSSLVLTMVSRLRQTWQTTKSNVHRTGVKVATAFLLILVATGVFYSNMDAYSWIRHDQVEVPVQQASVFAAKFLKPNQTIAVLFPVNRFNKYEVTLFLSMIHPYHDVNQTWQYPQAAADSFTPSFDLSEFTNLCNQRRTTFALLYENNNETYFNSSLNSHEVYRTIMSQTSYFSPEATFGNEPHRIYIFKFVPSV